MIMSVIDGSYILTILVAAGSIVSYLYTRVREFKIKRKVNPVIWKEYESMTNLLLNWLGNDAQHMSAMKALAILDQAEATLRFQLGGGNDAT
jgi:hypothetical protein